MSWVLMNSGRVSVTIRKSVKSSEEVYQPITVVEDRLRKFILSQLCYAM